MVKLILISAIITICISCQSQTSNGNRIIPQSNDSIHFPDWRNIVNFDSINVHEFVLRLKIENKEPNQLQVLMIGIPSKENWVNESDLKYLMTLIESNEQVKCVMQLISSELPLRDYSTLGGQAMNLIESFRFKKKYPFYLTDCSKTDTARIKEIKEWWHKLNK